MTEESPAGAVGTQERPAQEQRGRGYRFWESRTPAAEDPARIARRRARRLRLTEKTYQLIDYAFLLLYGLLAIRFLLRLAAANEQAGFFKFIRLVTEPFFSPFADLVASPQLGKGVFDLPLLICMLAFLLLHVALRGLLHVLSGSRTRTEG